MADFKDRLKEALYVRKMSAAELSRVANVNEGAISQYKKGAYKATQENLDRIANALNVSIAWLMGADVPMTPTNTQNYHSPTITEDTVTYPVIGELAAGYENIALEDWTGETVEIPTHYLKGRERTDYIVLKVKGDSMYPHYQNGDIVLILKQDTLDHSGEIGAVLYDNEYATLKKVEYVNGEDWMKLIPLNPEYMPRTIEGVDLERCRVIGVPRLLIRDLS